MAGKPPKFRAKYNQKDTKRWTEVGAGWENDNGSISLDINVPMFLDPEKGKIVLFVNEQRSGAPGGAGGGGGQRRGRDDSELF